MEPGEFERDFGITHIAVMGFDRRDSSDMELVDGRPFYRRSWRLCSPACTPENNSEGR